MRRELCICATFTAVPTQTRVVVVMHRREVHKPTNTGRLALRCLTNAELRIRGPQESPVELHDLVSPERRLWLLFPSEHAVTVTPELVAGDPRPITLVVPDGTWAQARRFVHRTPLLADALHVLPPTGLPTRYQLRHEHVDGGLATAEALARLLRVTDGDAPADAIEAAFAAVVEAVLRSRGVRGLEADGPSAPAERDGQD